MPHESAGTRRNSRYGRPEAVCLTISFSSSNARQSSAMAPLPSSVPEVEQALLPGAGECAKGENSIRGGERRDVAVRGQPGAPLVEPEAHLEEAAAERRQPERPAGGRRDRDAVRDRRGEHLLARAEPRLHQVAAAAVEPSSRRFVTNRATRSPSAGCETSVSPR